MRSLASCFFLAFVLIAPRAALADECDDKCAPAKAAWDDAEKRAASADDDERTKRGEAAAGKDEVARLEKSIADAKQQKQAALDDLAKPGADAQKLAQAVRDADAAIDDATKKLGAAKEAQGKREAAAKGAADAAAKAKGDAAAARKGYEDCRAQCGQGGAPAAGPGKSGLSIGARSGVSLPFGAVESGSALSDQFAAMLPLQLEVAWRFSDRFQIGAYAQYGFLFEAKGACENTTACSASNIRLGVAAEYHLLPVGLITPWFGAGTGYEVTSTSVTLVGGGDASSSIEGWEILHLQGGADFRALPRLLVGPFASLSFGMDLHGSSGDVPGKRLHEWLTLGARARFDVM
jgi:hypothetical protein